jgi:hypothetical protein
MQRVQKVIMLKLYLPQIRAMGQSKTSNNPQVTELK